jgi:uncharacterized membrane protein YbhN (UPF0104 family)
VTWQQIWDGLAAVPPSQLALALLVTAINFVILTGYDWIAIQYLRKKLPWRKIMVGAVVGYAFSNLFGWILGGTSVRYRLYTRWGFELIEVIAFISILSITFWLGMFLLAGFALVSLPVHLPEQYSSLMPASPETLGYLFLAVVAIYLLASIFVRKPVRIGNQSFTLPPFRLSLVQLAVSAFDFALASLVLYLLLPADASMGYGTVLVSYIVAMVVTVILHVPGGFGVLELIVLNMLTKDLVSEQSVTQIVDGMTKDSSVDPLMVGVTCGILLFRLIYYFLPGIVAGLLFLGEEYRSRLAKSSQPLGQ